MTTSTTSNAIASLPRCPLVSDAIAKENNVYFEIDTRFRRAARLLQALWLKDHSIETGIHVRGEGEDTVVMPLASNLSSAAAASGMNFLSSAIHAFVRQQLILREEGAAIEEERLFGNALSSMPMTFNLFAPLAMDLDLATRVLKTLFPTFVDKVEGFLFEHSPGRREERFLNDGTAFDLAVQIITPDGEPGTIFVETKLSEDMMGPAARLRDRYDEVSRSSRLFVDPGSPQLRTLALEQLWRENMLAQLCVDQGITQRALFVGIGPRLNRRVMAAFRVFQNELIPEDDRDDNRVPFIGLTLESLVDAIETAGATELAHNLRARYLDYARIYHLCLSSAIPIEAELTPSKPVTGDKTVRKQLVQSLAKSSRASSRRL